MGRRNRPRLVMLLIALTAVIGGANVWTVNAQVEDTAAPALAEFDFNPKTIDVSPGPQTVTVTLRITDDLSGFEFGNGFGLGSVAGTGPKKTIDVFVDRAVGGNPFKPFGTWTKTF